MNCADVPTFTAEEDGVHVRISPPGRPGECVRTTMAMGLRLWAAGGAAPKKRGTGPYAVLSYAIHPAGDTGVHICIGDSRTELSPTRQPPWPEWHPSTPPAWHAVPEGQWLSVPRTDDPPEAVVDAAARSLKVREKGIADELQQRCTDVVRHGVDETVQETLDYYTTLRVKRAFQCMNARDLADRERDVERMRVALGALLRSAPPCLAADWPGPESCDGADGSGTGSGRDNDDPNVLCVPQPEDYAEEHFFL